MENKQSFYKTFEEKLVKGITDKNYNDYVGGTENAILDGDDYTPFTEEDLIGWIVNELLKTKRALLTEDGWALEPKHIRFIGKERLKEIVEHRVKFRHEKEGRWSWER